MKIPWRARTSLFARMSLIFGALVTVPLAVSGLILALVGRSSVLASGASMSALGERAVQSASESLVRQVENTLGDVADQVSLSAQSALEGASKRHIQTSQDAVGQATDRIVEQGRVALKKAGEESATVGQQAVTDAARALRELHHDSLTSLKTQFVARTRAELDSATAQVSPQLEKSVLELAHSINEQKATAVISAAQRGLDLVELRLAFVARLSFVQEFESDASSPAMMLLLKGQPSQLPIVQVALVSPSGEEIRRVPDTDAPAADYTAELGEAQKEPTTVLPLRTGPGGAPVLRVVQQVFSLDDARARGNRRFGALVADVSLATTVDLTTRRTGSNNVVLLVTAEGRVLSSREAQQVGQTIPALRDELKRTPALPMRRFSLVNGPETFLGVATGWPGPTLPEAATQDLFAVVLQPISEARKPLEELQPRVTGAWQKALENVGASSESDIQRRMDQLLPQQRAIAAAAGSRIEDKIRQAGERVPKVLQGSRNVILKESQHRIALQTQQATNETAAAIRKAEVEIARGARGKLHWISEAESYRSIQVMNHEARREANTIAGRMILNSAWLILVFLGGALLLATMTSRSIVSPLNRLVRGTQAVATGDYTQRIRVEGEDELARLAIAFNVMAAAIEGGRAELQESNEGLAAQKRRMQTIVDSSPDGLVMIEPTGQVGFMNPAAQEMLQLNGASGACSTGLLRDLPAPVAARLDEILGNLEPGGMAAEMEIADPHRRVLQYRGVSIAGDDGKRPGLLLHLHDITRERRIDEMKSEFVSLVSHELRTPLTSILGFSSYLLTGRLGEINDQQLKALDSIHRQSKRLSAIISDFLDVSRIESGRIEMRRDSVPVDSVVRRVIADLQPQASEKALRISTRTEPDVVATGDEARIAQIFTNLLGNAIKFSDSAGRIDVVVAHRNGEVVCSVRDTGCGIPADELERVFDRFYQVEKVVTRKSGGTGLGLAIVKNIVEAHGGKIWIESTFGKGTEVSFSLPGVES